MPGEIRQIAASDIARISDIWLEASLRAHDFVPESFWRRDYEVMKGELLPRAHGFVHVTAGKVDAFITIGQGVVECLFVDPERQGRGIGGALLKRVQSLHKELRLKVYEQNVRARAFYHAHGFRDIGRSTCPYTGAPEVCMEWMEQDG